jgi:hypothetical protein
MSERSMVRAGGLAFIVGALAFVGVFSYLAVAFDYPAVLEGRASEVLHYLRAGGEAMRAVWALYALLPLFLLPGAVGAWASCPGQRPRMTLALVLAGLASLSMCLGLMRWPSVHWAMAGVYAEADASVQQTLDVVFDGLNLYLGNYIGEFLGETLLAAFFLLTALSQQAQGRFPRWLVWGGIGFGLLFLLGAFRNVTSSVQGIADINNALLPLWMIALGTGMLRHPGN